MRIFFGPKRIFRGDHAFLHFAPIGVTVIFSLFLQKQANLLNALQCIFTFFSLNARFDSSFLVSTIIIDSFTIFTDIHHSLSCKLTFRTINSFQVAKILTDTHFSL